MLAAIYRLRSNGVKLQCPQAAVVGQLQLRHHAVGSRNPQARIAQLLGNDGNDRLAPLHDAEVRRITREGIVIVGTELIGRDSTKARVRAFGQTWWCLLLTDVSVHRVSDTPPVRQTE